MRKKIIDTLSSWLERPWGYPLLLLLIGAVTYGYAVTQLGFYWDDWEVIYLTQLASLQNLFGYFMYERPFAWSYPLYATVLGAYPLGWHIITFLLRYGGILFIYQALSQVWPARKFELRWLGLLMLVFPGFLQQSISSAYSRHFTSFFLFSLSLYWSVLAVRARSSAGRWLYWIGALLTGVLQIFTIEYYVALEFVRPLLLWFLFDEGNSWKKLRKVSLSWLPFLVAFGCFVWWKMIYIPSTRTVHVIGTADKLAKSFGVSPLAGSLTLVQNTFFDTLHLLFQAWYINTYNADTLDFTARITLLALVLGLALAAIAFMAIRYEPTDKDKFHKQALLLGSAALIFGGLPVWAFGKRMTEGGLWGDRFSQGPMLGAVLLVVLLISFLVRARWRSAVLAVLLFSAITTQVVFVNKYRIDWENQKNIYWEMYWRAPALSPNTAIYSQHIFSTTLPNYDAGYAFSLLYAADKTGTKIPYWFFPSETIPALRLERGKAPQASYRNINFTASPGNGISVFYHPSRGCLRVLDPVYQKDPTFFEDQTALIALSNTARIQAASKHVPNPAIFGNEPAHDWCYFFEKGDLARQLRDWKVATQLYVQATALGLSPNNAGEYLPFIEAYARQPDFAKALDLTMRAGKMKPDTKITLCANWQRLSKELKVPADMLGKIQTTLTCAWKP